MPQIIPSLWFDTQALEAAEFYVSIFPNSKITFVSHYPEGGDRAGSVLTVDFVLDGAPVSALNGGPQFTFDEAVSLVVDCADQDEIDHYWDALVAGGGEHGPCGWLKDKYGLSWQISPNQAFFDLAEGDPERYARAMAAMMQMGKIDIAAMQAAADGT
jgi:predicted 3-demethylubiquinone-9 3-methyltransferase (glyoxalase superfamily)